MAYRLAILALVVAGLGGSSGCDTVDVETQPVDINRCRPDRAFFAQKIWPEFLDKDIGGKRCTDARCHDSSSGRQMILTRPTTPPTLPFAADWEAVYKSVTNQMQCTSVLESDPVSRPDGRRTHGGGKLIEPNGPEVQLVLQWVAPK
jgi:hypothetical protein